MIHDSNKIIINNVSFSYGRKRDFQFNDISLSIPEKSITAVIGKNGSGKTTLLMLILGYLKPEEGLIRISRFDNYIPVNELNGDIAYLPQNEAIPKDYSIDNFLLMGRLPFINQFSQPDIRDQAVIENVKATLGIEHLGREKLGEISGGELQKVRIGRALTQETDIILFDEPITHLDIENRYKMISLMNDLKKIGKSIIFTTHDPVEAFQSADYALLISDDQKVLFGSKSKILNKKNLSDCLKIDIEIEEIKGQKVIILSD